MKFNIENISKDLLPKGTILQEQSENEPIKTWKLWMQFDNDSPVMAVENIKLGERLSISWNGPGETSEIRFKDPTTNKVFRLFGKLDR